MKKLLPALMIAFSLAFVTACKKHEEDGYLRIRMTDAPANYQQVNVEILQVSVHMNNNGGWVNLPTNSGIYDLLALQNGIDTTIVSLAPLPAGEITQMRLLLGTNNTIMVDNILYPLTVPSGSQAGIKLNGHIAVPGNTTVNVLLDFVAGESIVVEGNGSFKLKPVVKVLP